jgi:hypothetical protein
MKRNVNRFPGVHGARRGDAIRQLMSPPVLNQKKIGFKP